MLPEPQPLGVRIERRRRFRCTGCWLEWVTYPSHVGEFPSHDRVEMIEGGPDDGGWRRVVCGSWEPVGRLPRGKASA